MRNVNDMNDLYNVWDIIRLCEIIENRFELMHKMYGCNTGKRNSPISLSGCTEKYMSKIIIDLPTNNAMMEGFEKTITGGFSCVNTRIGLTFTFYHQSILNHSIIRWILVKVFKSYQNKI